jgi:hypothetical protein
MIIRIEQEWQQTGEIGKVIDQADILQTQFNQIVKEYYQVIKEQQQQEIKPLVNEIEVDDPIYIIITNANYNSPIKFICKHEKAFTYVIMVLLAIKFFVINASLILR